MSKQNEAGTKGHKTARHKWRDVSRLATTAAVAEPFTLSAVGDLIYLRPILRTLEERAPKMLELLRDADVVYGNLETNLFDLDDPSDAEEIVPEAASGGTWMHASPEIASDLAALGFNVLAGANNHAGDWGRGGMRSTIHHIAQHGVALAGLGDTLARATLPHYTELSFGRIGHVSATTTYTPHSRAADPSGLVPGRAGVNAIRLTSVTALDAAAFKNLEHLCADVGDMVGRIIEPGVELDWQGSRFILQDDSVNTELSYRVNEADMKRNLMAIRQARQNSNFTIFSVHSHEPYNESTEPAAALIEIAHAAVESGADLVLCHGPHQLRGVETYRNVPIVYSLGNFFMMNNSLDVVPAEFIADVSQRYEVDEIDLLTVPEQFAVRNRQMFSKTEMLESAIFRFQFSANGELSEIRAYPIDLGTNQTGSDIGVPLPAGQDVALRILERLASLSKPFGTTFKIQDDGGGLFAAHTVN